MYPDISSGMSMPPSRNSSTMLATDPFDIPACCDISSYGVPSRNNCTTLSFFLYSISLTLILLPIQTINLHIRYAENDIAVEYANAYLGDIFLTIRRLDRAEKHLKMAITIAPGNSHYYYLLGFSYSIKEQWAKAVTQFRKAIRLDPDNSEYERGLGWVMFNAGNKAEGLNHLYRALELLSSNLHAMTDLATAMLMLCNILLLPTHVSRRYCV